MKVTLSWAELLLAAQAGVMRYVQNIQKGRPDRYGADPHDGWTLHINGTCGEMVVAKALGKYWSGSIGNLTADDVGDLQVRTKNNPIHTDLILHPQDDDNKVFVLVSGKAPTWDILGWIKGIDGKKQEYWRDPIGGRPAFFVPLSALQPADALLPDPDEIPFSATS